jgi:MFS family permease
VVQPRAPWARQALALASFVLSFVHRTAPAAIAGELTQAFAISSAVLGTLAATYFYVYTLLQIPVGVLADTLGPRRILTAGSAIAAAGSLLFALAPAWEIAAVGRTLVGVGVSVAFIAVLKISAVWFAPGRFATLAGVTMFAGNLGAVAAGAPLAWAGDRHLVARGVRRARSAVGAAGAGHLAARARLAAELGFAPVAGAVPLGARAVDAGGGTRARQPPPGRRSSSTPASAAATSPSPACGACRTCSRSTACRG